MELDIGSNVITNTTGILTVQGKKQISLEVGDDLTPFSGHTEELTL